MLSDNIPTGNATVGLNDRCKSDALAYFVELKLLTINCLYSFHSSPGRYGLELGDFKYSPFILV